MKGDRKFARILSVQIISKADRRLLEKFFLPEKYVSLGIISTDCDDISYTALDEATKRSDVIVAYARSMYAGAENATNPITGEFIGVLAGRDPESVKSGLKAAIDMIEKKAFFLSAADDDSIFYFAHCISKSGTYLSKKAGVEEGTPLAYLIAPPIAALLGINKVLKNVDIEMKIFYGPPTETNFSGALLSGAQSMCERACKIFSESVCRVSEEKFCF